MTTRFTDLTQQNIEALQAWHLRAFAGMRYANDNPRYREPAGAALDSYFKVIEKAGRIYHSALWDEHNGLDHRNKLVP